MARTFLDDGRIEFRPRERAASPLRARRSDQRILEDLRGRLARAGIDTGQVAITVADGAVRLVGSVPSRRTRQAIEEAAVRCTGVRHVENRIRIGRAPPARYG
jgi:osmotically-inducible protein OsmY